MVTQSQIKSQENIALAPPRYLIAFSIRQNALTEF